MSKILSVRINEDLYTKCLQHELSNKELVSLSLHDYFNGVNDCTQDVYEDVYNEAYTTVYNLEILPLKQDIFYLKDKVHGLEQDKTFLSEQLKAQTVISVAKLPLLSRLKLLVRGSSP